MAKGHDGGVAVGAAISRLPARTPEACGAETRPGWVRADVACKGALPVADAATAAVGQPLALAGRNADREGLAATRTIGPYIYNGLSFSP